MAYEYEGKLLDYASGSKTYEEYKEMTQELKEVYRKAKAFDTIVNIQDDFVKYHGFYPCIEEYAEEVEKIISEYLESSDDERRN